ncbi:MAG: hypothetical protein U1F41_15105 [Burkholderiales bacterium]
MDRREFLLAAPALLAGGCVSVGGAAGPPAPAPALRVGDRWVYNCADGFRVKVEWVETHEVIGINANGIAVRVTLVGPTMNYNRVEQWQAPGVIVVGSIYDDAFNREFRAPLVRYQFPLTPNTEWRQSIQYPDPANQLVSNVQRYVKVGGYETVVTPAGTFNAVTMRTIMSVDNNNPFYWPTQCDYVTWWAPEVGAKVKETKYATYRERGDEQAIQIRAQNTLIELVSFARGAP